MDVKNQEQTYKKPGAGAILGGVLAGSVVQGLVSAPTQKINPKLMNEMIQISKNLTDDEFKAVAKLPEQIIESSGLKKKGIKIIRANKANEKEVAEIMAKEFDGNIITKFIPKTVKDLLGNVLGDITQSGQNAFYANMSKKLVLPEKGLELGFFHEVGHALNENMSKIGKIAFRSRALSLLALPIGFIALWKTKKAPGEKPKNAIDSTNTFIKENAGKLTFAAYLPVLIDECLASVKGNKFAKQLLKPELAKKVEKSNALGFCTYIGLALASSIGIYLGTKVKDAIAKPTPVKKQESKTEKAA